MNNVLTTVTDTLYAPDGTPVNGKLCITNTSTMIDANGNEIAQGTTIFTPVVDGLFSVELTPNLGLTPTGTSYQVKYAVTDQWYFEVWVVPTTPNPANLADVRALSTPQPGILVPLAQVVPSSDFEPGDVPEWTGTQWQPQLVSATQIILTAGVNINAYQVVSMHSDGLAYVADAGTISDAGHVVGIAITSAEWVTPSLSK